MLTSNLGAVMDPGGSMPVQTPLKDLLALAALIQARNALDAADTQPAKL